MTVFAPEAEAALLGVMLDDADALDAALPRLTDDDFTTDLHRKVFARITRLVAKGDAIDVQTVCSRTKLDRLAVHDLTNAYTVAASWPTYLKQVQEASGARAQARVLSEARDLLLEGDLEGANARLADLPSPVMVEDDDRWDPEALGDAMLDRYERVIAGDDVYGIPSGFPTLDDQYAPFLRFAGISLVFGVEGSGKTVFATNVIRHVVESGRRVLVLTMEADQQDVFDALVRIIGNLDGRRIVAGTLHDAEVRAMTDASAHVQATFADALDVWYPTTYGSLPVASIEARARAHRADLVVIDHVQLLAQSEDRRAFELAAISRNLKVMAGRLHAPVLCLSAVNKEAHKRGGMAAVPDAMDLRDSGMLGHDACNVVGVQQMTQHDLRLHGKKARYGKRAGIVRLKWQPATGLLSDDGYFDPSYDIPTNGHQRTLSPHELARAGKVLTALSTPRGDD